MIQICTLQRLYNAFALIDSETEVNFISQHWMKENNLPDTDNLPHEIQALNKHYIKFYSHHILEVQIMNICMMTHNHAHAFKTVDLSDYDLILDYSWLQVINPDVDWVTKK